MSDIIYTYTMRTFTNEVYNKAESVDQGKRYQDFSFVNMLDSYPSCSAHYHECDKWCKSLKHNKNNNWFHTSCLRDFLDRFMQEPSYYTPGVKYTAFVYILANTIRLGRREDSPPMEIYITVGHTSEIDRVERTGSYIAEDIDHLREDIEYAWNGTKHENCEKMVWETYPYSASYVHENGFEVVNILKEGGLDDHVDDAFVDADV